MSEKNEDSQEIVREAKGSTSFIKEEGKTYNSDLAMILGGLTGLPQKSPIAFEVSRASKKVAAANVSFEESRLEIMLGYILRDEKGEFVINEETQRVIEEYEKKGQKVSPTVFGYVTEGSRERKLEYIEVMNGLLNSEVVLNLRSVNASTKLIKTEEGKLLLIDCLSDYFESGQINFLEEIGILTGLDD